MGYDLSCLISFIPFIPDDYASFFLGLMRLVEFDVKLTL